MFQKSISTNFDRMYHSSLIFFLFLISFFFCFFSKGVVTEASLVMEIFTTSVSHGATQTEIINSG